MVNCHRKWKRWVCCALVVVLGFVCVGCGKKNVETVSKQSESTDRIRIGVTFDSFVIERWQRDRDVFVSTAKDLGADVNVQSANGDLEEQKKQIEYFIESEMDVIVIVCIDSDGLADAVADAKAAGIKVIAYDRLIRNADVDLYISFDNEMVGKLMAEAVVGAGVENGKVLMLGGDSADYNVPQVEDAFSSGMEQHGNEIVGSMHARGWRAEDAAEYIYNHLDQVEQVDAIMCGNDSLASQVIRALSERRLAGNICVVGQDAELEACQHIVEGTQEMTVYKPVERLAHLTAECAVALAKGEDIPNTEVLTFHDGIYEVPYVKLDPIMVNKENMDEVIINGGFHLKEDVYLNVAD
ncbi:MAG: substrate-binding domain-containing protein [Eubacteriales bacterium]|nr:substrate-binding domain-containing protein [Eubacteriales bacterium]